MKPTTVVIRNQKVDILRALAITFVFGKHMGHPWILTLIRGVGVDLFFVLSGFLVSGLLFSEYIKHGTIQSGRFLIRRGFKIYPQFYLLAAITLVWATFYTPEGLPNVQFGNIIREMLFMQNYAPGLWWPYTWSLAVEEHFYIVLALAITLIAKRWSFKVLPLGIAVTCLLVFLGRIVTWILSPQADNYVHYSPTHLRIDSLLIGVLVSYCYSFHREELARMVRKYQPWLTPVSLICLTPILFLNQFSPFIYTIGFSLIAIGFAIVLLKVIHSESQPGVCVQVAA
jgi:peptidoglycan/LPS O-acetylase OafA/YrhL